VYRGFQKTLTTTLLMLHDYTFN